MKVAFPTAISILTNGQTLIRTRGELLISLLTANVIGAGYKQVSCGICVVSTDAAGVGATAIPGPRSDSDWGGWLWFWTGSFFAPGSITESEWLGQEGTLKFFIWFYGSEYNNFHNFIPFCNF